MDLVYVKPHWICLKTILLPKDVIASRLTSLSCALVLFLSPLSISPIFDVKLKISLANRSYRDDPKKMSKDDNVKAVSGDPQHRYPPPPAEQQYPPPQYGTFQGVSNYPPPPQPAIGFPHPVPPPGAGDPSAPQYYPHGYQASPPGYAVVEGMPVRERRLPCCGIGFGWFLFIIGFFLGAIPWYIGVIILLCSRIDHREKPGYVACTIAAGLATIAIIIGATGGAHDWDRLVTFR